MASEDIPDYVALDQDYSEENFGKAFEESEYKALLLPFLIQYKAFEYSGEIFTSEGCDKLELLARYVDIPPMKVNDYFPKKDKDVRNKILRRKIPLKVPEDPERKNIIDKIDPPRFF